MENPEIIINALTNEIASLKCQHRDELERVRMERRAADINMKDQLSAQGIREPLFWQQTKILRTYKALSSWRSST